MEAYEDNYGYFLPLGVSTSASFDDVKEYIIKKEEVPFEEYEGELELQAEIIIEGDAVLRMGMGKDYSGPYFRGWIMFYVYNELGKDYIFKIYRKVKAHE